MLTKKENCALDLIYTCDALEDHNRVQVGTFRFSMGREMGKEIRNKLPNVDYVVPVPQSGLYYAMGLSEELKVPYLQALVKVDETKRTLSCEQKERLMLLKKEIAVIPSLLEKKKIVLVDEAIFTGATLKFICEKLKNIVEEIYICIPTSRCINVCQRLPQKDLLARKMSDEAMCRYFGANGLYFQSEERFVEVSASVEGLCMECFHQVKMI